VGKSTDPAADLTSDSDASGVAAIARVNYVAFTEEGTLADVGKAITIWNGTVVPLGR